MGLGVLLFAPTGAAQERSAPDSAEEASEGQTEQAATEDTGEIASDSSDAEAMEEQAIDEPVVEEQPVEEPPPFQPRTIDPVLLARGLERGAVVYRTNCASCHGRRGDGRGPAARFLSVPPRDLTTGVYKWRTTASGDLPTDADLLRSVRQGAAGTPMPAWDGLLSIRDMWSVVQYIKTFSPRFAEEGPAAPLAMQREAPTVDDASRRRGRLMYVMLQCWTCHGMNGTGDGPASGTLRDDNDHPIAAYDFTQNTMRAGSRPFDVYRTFTTGVNGTPMPSYDEAIVVGRDGYQDLRNFEPVLSGEGMTELRRFIADMPTTEELWALPEQERQEWASRRRWDLVAYVRSLSGGDTFWRYLWSRSHAN